MKSYFFSRNLREKLLVLAFVVVVMAIWLSGSTKRLQTNYRAWRVAGTDLATQQVLLDNRAVIEAAATTAVDNLDADSTYDATKLVAEVMALAGNAGLQVSSDSPTTQRTSQFAFHSVRVSSRRAEMPAVIRFYAELAGRAPYLALEQLTIQQDRGAAGMVNVTFQVASVELVR
ncbi:general secretion pathway protein GspM [Opitutaceae bacterium TAV4]|uniref:GspMb/PilO family protein n=1 Tax=Geminisphaera colitermitum TaxID=1148786 RepID=UPI000158C8E6|nr:GspMb/PilO family protein [Geminisphaera colitermitum]RRJ95552.1 general secretion pathway protein GspM [Opitutaceae bacterium TAV4]RRJ99858.1 general secretion pathway protein GspM [Opitutaceae bacterium TAV3]